MEPLEGNAQRRRIGRILGIFVVAGAVLALILALIQTDRYPRTDDASVRANFIEIAPEVNGRLIHLPIKDNAHVAKGDLLFEIDPRPYQYILEQALSDQASLEQQVVDERRKIAAEQSAVEAAQAGVHQSTTGVQTANTNIDVAAATISREKAAVAAAEARLKLATNDLHRIEPLLKKQYVTVEQVDQATTAATVAQGNLDEAYAALVQSQAQQAQSVSRRQEADALARESQAKLGQAIHTVDRLETILSLRQGKAAKVETARLDLERTRVVAPFDAYVTNMNISEGAYASAGKPLFTLIDTRTWYVIANYRESKLKTIHLGSPVDVFVMGHPDRKFDGVVESIGYGVLPEDGKVVAGLPDIERTLNWVHLSTRFPVRVRIRNPDPAIFRIGATAVTVMR
jgi:multidrug efflux system membrane fusion protein